MPHEEARDFQRSGISRLASSVAAIKSLFPDSWTRSDEPPRATWPDRMGLVHQLDDRWNYVQQPQERPVPRRDRPYAWIQPIPPREMSVATIRALFSNVWAQSCRAPTPVVWHNGIRDWPIADDEVRDIEDEEDDEYEDWGSDWDSEFEYKWGSDSGIDSESDGESCEDSSSTSSMRQPSPNEYLRRLEEVEDREMYMYRECPYCELQIQYMYDVRQVNEGYQPDENWHWAW